jgi:hypothetical protein
MGVALGGVFHAAHAAGMLLQVTAATNTCMCTTTSCSAAIGVLLMGPALTGYSKGVACMVNAWVACYSYVHGCLTAFGVRKSFFPMLSGQLVH